VGSAGLKVRMTRPSAVKKSETCGNQIWFPIRVEFYRNTKIKKFTGNRFDEIMRRRVLSPCCHRGPSRETVVVRQEMIAAVTE
jgi:hypothetical protein